MRVHTQPLTGVEQQSSSSKSTSTPQIASSTDSISQKSSRLLHDSFEDNIYKSLLLELLLNMLLDMLLNMLHKPPECWQKIAAALQVGLARTFLDETCGS